MKAVVCPKCQVAMQEREKGDVLIDICPQCRGVWLDAGELEKLSLRETRYYYDDDDVDDDHERSGDYRRRRDYDNSRVQSYPRKKKGFLQSMMESFGDEGDD